MFVAYPLQTGSFDHEPAGTFDHQPSRFRQAGEALATADKDRHAQLVFELADLFADAGLRREQNFRRIGDVEAMVYNGDKVTQLLQVHGVGVAAELVIIVGPRLGPNVGTMRP
jgi:hypothetical protein